MTTNNTRVQDIKDVQPTQEVKKQKVSATYTLRAAGENVTKLEGLGLISKEDAGKMREILRVAVATYVGQSMGI